MAFFTYFSDASTEGYLATGYSKWELFWDSIRKVCMMLF